MRAMKEMSIVQMVRWAVNLLVVCTVCFVVREIKFVSIGFLLGELTAFSFSLFFLWRLKFRFSINMYGLKRHFAFGSSCLLMSGIDELNARADILMLAWLGSESTVGLYSLAAMFSKGSMLFMDVLQVNFSPIISRLSRSGFYSELKDSLSKMERMSYLLFAPIVLGTIWIYFYYIRFFMGLEFEGSILVFVILQIGAFLYSGANAYGKFFVNTGQPRIQAMISLVALVVNILLNFVLIRLWGANGAATATTLSLLLAALLLRYFSRKALVAAS